MKKLIIIASFVFIGVGAYAQPAKGTPAGAPVPLDGGISLLIAAGAAIGGKVAYDKRRRPE